MVEVLPFLVNCILNCLWGAVMRVDGGTLKVWDLMVWHVMMIHRVLVLPLVAFERSREDATLFEPGRFVAQVADDEVEHL